MSGVPGGLPAVCLFVLSILAYVAQVSFFDLGLVYGSLRLAEGGRKSCLRLQEL